MIILDFVNFITDDERRRARFEKLSADRMDMDLMYGNLVFDVNGIDIAWKGPLALLDVVRQLLWVDDRIAATAPNQSIELLDYYESLRVKLIEDSRLELHSAFAGGHAVCDRNEFHEAVMSFSRRVIRAFYERYPQASGKKALREFLPPNIDTDPERWT